MLLSPAPGVASILKVKTSSSADVVARAVDPPGGLMHTSAQFLRGRIFSYLGNSALKVRTCTSSIFHAAEADNE